MPDRIGPYELTGTLAESRTMLVVRGRRLSDDVAVVLKILKPSAVERDSVCLKREFAILSKAIIPGVIKAYSLEESEQGLIMALEDIGGESLDRPLTNKEKITLENFLELASGLAETLARLHEQRIVHKGINPAHIIVNKKTGDFRLIGFGATDEQMQQVLSAQTPATLEDLLEYISPEQTGRMNRAVDYRTDFYSLGVTCYQLLTGKLPFVASDALGIIHLHIAGTPVAPHNLDPTIPETVSRIIMKLLAKMADDRYQNAWGLKADLDRCRREWRIQGAISDFEPGLQDFSDHLRMPQILYGRDQELKLLLDAFQRVCAGEKELLLVAGYAGVGKTRLVRELRRSVLEKQGYFIEGKFEQLQRAIPYWGWIQAFAGFVNYLLMENETQLEKWREDISRAVGNIGKVLTDVIPNLELIIGRQPEVPQLDIAESKNRFNYVFQEFSGCIATRDHPLIVFLDDLQWIDEASLNLLTILISSIRVSNFFLIGAYRGNEVDALHPLSIVIKSLQKEKTNVDVMTLEDLLKETVNEMISDLLGHNRSETILLTNLIYSKTGGNPFFLFQTLRMLAEKHAITFDFQKKLWKWDISALKGMELSDNVVTLMLGRIQNLPLDTQQILSLAAFMGYKFNSTNLGIIAEQSVAFVLQNLLPAERDELIVSINSGYQFAHDRIQQAAFSLIPEEERPAVHLRIGRKLYSLIKQEELTEKSFEIVNHLNQAIELITDPAERAQLAELNVTAGKKARTSVAFMPALNNFTTAADLLPEGTWETRYDFMFALYLDLAECEFMTGDFEKAEMLFDLLLAYSKSEIDKATIYKLRLKVYQVAGMYDDAVVMGLKALQLFGVEIPSNDEVLNGEIEAEAAAVKLHLHGRKIADLADAPEATDPRARAVIGLLSNVAPPAYIGSRPQIFPLIILNLVNYTLRYGPTSESCHGYSAYGFLLTSIFNDPYTANAFSDIAIKQSERFGDLSLIGTVLYLHGNHINLWRSPLATDFPVLERGFLVSVEAGNIVYANYIAYSIVWQAVERGDILGEVLSFSRNYASFALNSRNEAIYQTIVLEQQFLKCLMDETDGNVSFSNNKLDELSCVMKIAKASFTCGITFYHTMKMFVAYLMGNDDESRIHAEEAEKRLSAVRAMPMESTFIFLNALVLARASYHAENEVRGRILKVLTSRQDTLGFWAKNCPDNFLCKYALVSAEIAYINGDIVSAEQLFEQAIESARANKFIHWEGMANEAAAHFYGKRGFVTISQAYFQKARYCFVLWGAVSKVQQLENQNPWLVYIKQQPSAALEKRALDLETLMKASHAISSEIEMNKLLNQVMHIVIENAGAQYGYLLIEKDGKWTVIAKGEIDQTKVEHPLEVNIDGSKLVSPGVVRFVARTKSKIVLDNAGTQGEFANDQYIRKNKTQSLLCAPLLHRGKLISILYLENNLTTHTFTPERVQFLEMLLSQVAISLENAIIYESLRKSEAKYRLIVETANEGVIAIGPDERISFANNRIAEMLGFSPGEIFRQPVTVLIPEEDWPDAEQRIKNSRHGMSENFEIRLLRKDSRIIWIQVSAAPMFDDEHHYSGSFAMVTDITERKEAEQRLVLLNFALDNVGIAVFLIDETAHVHYINNESCNFLGYSREELLQLSVWDFDVDLPPELWPKVWDDLKKKRSNHFGGRHRTKKGLIIPVEINANYFEFWGKAYSLAFVRDITERKRTEEELTKYRHHLEVLVTVRTKELSESNNQLQIAKELAEAANKEKSRFLANMSHELRTPLNAILGFSRLMKDAPDVPSEQKKNLDIINLSGEHLLNLINNVLDISKIESGRMVLDVVHVDLYHLMQELGSLLYVDAMERGLSFTVERSPELPRNIEIDGGKLRQILINLLGNAIKYTQHGGVILRAFPVKRESTENVWLKFEVEDTGPGISEEDRRWIFQPFVQLKRQGTIQTGTGLGLAISRQYVNILGGKIDVISQKGKGSTFFFEIPVKELPLEEIAIAPERGRVVGLEKGQPRYRLLIAEDQLENRILLHKILEPFGFDIREAVNGKEAVEIFEQWHPDLICIDMRMPVMDGLEATHRIRSTEAGTYTKIIAITAQAFEEDRLRIMKAGCDDFIRKPYREMEIFDALARHLGLRFVYEERPDTLQKESEVELRPEQLAIVPSDLIKELHSAVLGLDPERIQELTSQITDYNRAIGGALKKLAGRFDYGRLLQLLDEYAKK